MAVDQDAINLFQPQIDRIVARLDALEARPDGGMLFAARDNFETALFSAMQNMTDAEQVEFLKQEAERLRTAI